MHGQIPEIILISEKIATGYSKNRFESGYHRIMAIPGTAYFDPELDHLSAYYNSMPAKRCYFIALDESVRNNVVYGSMKKGGALFGKEKR